MEVLNQDIRKTAAKAGVKLWKIADQLGYTDSTFSRKLRKELSDTEKSKIYAIIEKLKEVV